MIDCSIDAFQQMITNRSTSYKLFLMKYILLYANSNKIRFSFKELSSGLLSCSFEYFEKRYKRYNKNDRIFDCLQYIFETYDNINIYTSQVLVYDFLMGSNDKIINNYLKEFLGCAVYRLLSPFVESVSLKNYVWNKQNKIIKYQSTLREMLYVIFDDSIQINLRWLNFIINNRELLIASLNEVIDYEFSK